MFDKRSLFVLLLGPNCVIFTFGFCFDGFDEIIQENKNFHCRCLVLCKEAFTELWTTSLMTERSKRLY